MIQVQLPSVSDAHVAAEAAELILYQFQERIGKWRCSGHKEAPSTFLVESEGTIRFRIEISTCCRVFEDQVAQTLAMGRAAA